MNYWKKLLAKMKRHLGQIPYILIYPFAIIVQFLYELVVMPYNFICEKLNKETLVKKKTERILQRTVSAILHGNSNLLNSSQNRYVAKLFTLLLQCISFITTYAGFTFFLGSLNPIAPLFMAITVQGLCFYLLNYTSSKKHSGGWKRALLLTVLILISITTSYIGVFDSVVKPVNEMSVQYNEYAKTVNNLINEEISQKHSYEIQYKDIEKIFRQFEAFVEEANDFIEILEFNSDNTETNQTIATSWVDEDGFIRYGSKTISIGDAVNKITSNNTKVKELNNAKEKISDYLSNDISEEKVFNSISKIIKKPQKLNKFSDKDKDVYNEFIDINEYSKQITGLIEEILFDEGRVESKNENELGLVSIDIDDAISSYNKREELTKLRLKEFSKIIPSDNKSVISDVNNDPISLSTIFGFFEELNKLVVSDKITEAEEIRELLTKTIEDNYASLVVLLSDEHKDTLQVVKDKTFFENTQVMPFTVPFEKNSFHLGEAVFSFVVAFVVDGLSVLISITLISKPKSILYFNNIRDMRKNREEIIESCLMYICLDGMDETLMKVEDIQKYVVDSVNTVMSDFINRTHYIYVPDGLNSFAYLSFDDIPEDNRYEKLLFQALNNAALLIPFHKSELTVVMREEFDGTGNDMDASVDILMEKYNSLFSDDKVYYFVSKNLHFWFCENFSELLQNSHPFISTSDDSKEV